MNLPECFCLLQLLQLDFLCVKFYDMKGDIRIYSFKIILSKCVCKSVCTRIVNALYVSHSRVDPIFDVVHICWRDCTVEIFA